MCQRESKPCVNVKYCLIRKSLWISGELQSKAHVKQPHFSHNKLHVTPGDHALGLLSQKSAPVCEFSSLRGVGNGDIDPNLFTRVVINLQLGV